LTGTVCAAWRIIEVGFCLVYAEGAVDVQGKLVGMPPEFCSPYNYDGHMELQIGCYKTIGIQWPSCNSGSVSMEGK